MSENMVEIVHCGFCGVGFPLAEYDEHWDKCEKRLAHPLYKKVKTPLKIVTNEEETPEEFLARIDEWEKPVPRRDRKPAAAAPLIRNPGEAEEAPVEVPDEIIDEEKTFLIRDRVLVEVNGKVEHPEGPVEEIPETETHEES